MTSHKFQKSRHVVIIGGGYAGLPCALRAAQLSRNSTANPPLRLTLIHPDIHQETTTELFRVLRDGRPKKLTLSSLLRKAHITHVEGHAKSINTLDREILLAGAQIRKIPYDCLVLATGLRPHIPTLPGLTELMAENNKPSEDPWADEFGSLKRVHMVRNNAQAIDLRLALKRLGWGDSVLQLRPRRNKRDCFVVVLGAGLSGIEYAAEIAAQRKRNPCARVLLVDSQENLAGQFSPLAQRKIRSVLAQLKIELHLGHAATQISRTHLSLADGSEIPWDLLVLCTGAKSPGRLAQCFDSAVLPEGLRVSENFQIHNYPDHFAIGDIAVHSHWCNQQTAQLSVQQGAWLGKYLAGKQSRNFSPSDLGCLMTLGPNQGIGRVGPATSSTSRLSHLSPFVIGPLVEALKSAAHLRYKSQLMLYSKISI